jgi:hypothetical protein
VAWRDFLTRQLQPGAEIETVDVFAQRQGISREAYYQVIHSEEEMDHQVFCILPRERVEEYRQAVLAENLQLIANYLAPDTVSRLNLKSALPSLENAGFSNDRA